MVLYAGSWRYGIVETVKGGRGEEGKRGRGEWETFNVPASIFFDFEITLYIPNFVIDLD